LLTRTYKRETARYSGNRMEDIENHFCADSNLVLSLLPSQFSMHEIYHVVLHSVTSILNAGIIKNMHAVAMIDASCANFATEYLITGSGYKVINADYSEFMLADHPQLTRSQQLNVNSYIKSFISVLIKCKSSLRPKLFTDLLHMHFNRLYNSSQRQHELVFYQFLTKFITTKNKPQ
jgi:thiopeptide-type bacteriocin biosynthesis protein